MAKTIIFDAFNLCIKQIVNKIPLSCSENVNNTITFFSVKKTESPYLCGCQIKFKNNENKLLKNILEIIYDGFVAVFWPHKRVGADV